MTRPADVLAGLVAADPGRPRVTAYEDTQGPTHGERVELSARVFATWVAKAANALQEDFDVSPGSTVRLALPAHWRALVWAFATWSAGGCVAFDDGPADVVVSDDPHVLATAGGPGVLVTLPALARAALVTVPPGVMDEARELPAHDDRFDPWDRPAEQDPALRRDGAVTAYRDLVPGRTLEPGLRLHTTTEHVAELVDLALGTWTVGGSLVHSRGARRDADLGARLASERVTASA
jgi:uncharacterized protein (TIGR03089 family)